MTGTGDGPEPTPRGALEIARRALAKANRIDDLEAKLADIEDELAAVKFRVSEQDDNRSYESYTLDEKVGLVREHAFEKATAGTGRAKLDYDDIMWEVFDGKPSADHCYKLMRLAADTRGFEYRNPDGESKHLGVDAREAKRGLVFSSANKTSSEGEVL